MSSSASLAWGGDAFLSKEIVIPLKKGWNWLGYVPTVELTPDVAFADAQPIRGDEIKGQAGFAQYDGARWVGSLQQLKPGRRVYVLFGRRKRRSIIQQPQSKLFFAKYDFECRYGKQCMELRPYKYPDNMSMIAAVYDGDMKMEPGIYSIGAFSG